MEEDKSARPGSALDLLCEGSKSKAVLPPSGLSEMFLSGEGEAWELGRKSKIGWTLGGGGMYDWTGRFEFALTTMLLYRPLSQHFLNGTIVSCALAYLEVMGGERSQSSWQV